MRWIGLFSLNVLFSGPEPRNLPFMSHKLCIHIHVDARERARAGKVWSEGAGCKRRVGLERETRPMGVWSPNVKPTCLARKYRSYQRFAPCKTDFEKSTNVLQSKRSIDKIQWFKWNFTLSSFHWNGTMEYEKVDELFSVAFFPSIAWGWLSNTPREWGTVKPNAYPLSTF